MSYQASLVDQLSAAGQQMMTLSIITRAGGVRDTNLAGQIQALRDLGAELSRAGLTHRPLPNNGAGFMAEATGNAWIKALDATTPLGATLARQNIIVIPFTGQTSECV